MEKSNVNTTIKVTVKSKTNVPITIQKVIAKKNVIKGNVDLDTEIYVNTQHIVTII